MANGEHPINGLMDVTLEKIRQMVDSNTIIGNPINTADGTTILPVSKVTYGFTSGGSDFMSSKAPKELFGGGSGAGISITPVAFLVLREDNVRLIQIAEKNNSVDRVLNLIPDVMDRVQGLVDKRVQKPAKSGAKAASRAAAEAGDTPSAGVAEDAEVEEIIIDIETDGEQI